MNLTLNLPKPHGEQIAPINSNASRKVLNCGRRAGKTEYLASFEAVPKMLGFRMKVTSAGKVLRLPIKDKYRILYGAPSDDQTAAFWDTAVRHLHPLIKAGYIYRNKSKRILEWISGGNGRIRAKTAYDADSWHGDWGNLLLFDEWAFTDPQAWEVVGMPMLLDKGGGAIFASTPNRKNHHFHHFNRGLDPEDRRWASFKFSSLKNPHLSEEALAELIQDMTQENYKQEILAEFLENEGAVFRNIGNCTNAPNSKPEDHKGHTLFAGVDWGKRNDFTVISIGCATCKHEVYLDRFNKIDYSFQRHRLEMAFRQWGVTDSMIELNSIGEPNFEELERSGLPVRGFDTTGTSKKPLIEGLGLALEQESWQFLNVPIATAELEAYEIIVSPRTGRVSYSAPSGVHDDTVIARALMNRAANSYAPAFL